MRLCKECGKTFKDDDTKTHCDAPQHLAPCGGLIIPKPKRKNLTSKDKKGKI